MDLVQIYEAPESHVAIVEELLKTAGIPFVRAPGVSGYPIVEPFVRLQVAQDRAEEATNLIRLGPTMPPPPPDEERELSLTPEMERPLAIVEESPEEAQRLVDEHLAERDPQTITLVYNLDFRVDEAAAQGPEAVTGSAEKIVDQLKSFIDLGFTAMNFSPVGPEPERQVERLAQEILPIVRRL